MAGAIARADTYEFCVRNAATSLRWVAGSPTLAEVAWLNGFFLLAWRVIRRARSHGAFTMGVATTTRQLGWFVLAGSCATALISSTATSIVMHEALRGYSVPWGVLLNFDAPWATWVAAAGILTFARLMRDAVLLQEDVDATV